jgi:hypothetical protein
MFRLDAADIDIEVEGLIVLEGDERKSCLNFF